MKQAMKSSQANALQVPLPASSFQRRLESSSFKALAVLLMILIATTLSATTLTSQSFESSTSDTWSYTANPDGMTRLVWWGRSDQPMGGANAQDGSWYWASWDIDNQEYSITFADQALATSCIHSLSFWYYTNGLNPDTDYSKYCVEYDAGTNWNNWVTLNTDTDAWTQVTLDIPVYVTTVRLKVAAKYDGFSKYAHWDNFSVSNTPAPPTAPLVYNTYVAQRTDGSKIVDIYYDIFDANNDLSTVTLQLSSDGGTSFNDFPNTANLSGDLGDNISNGTGKHIVWNAGADVITYNANQYIIRIIAEDNSEPFMPENFVLVEEGTFNNGISDVTISSFYCDKYEVTQDNYQTVMGANPAENFGVGTNYPVYYVTWFNAIEYCNRKSIQENLIPCYRYSDFGSNPNDWPAGWNDDMYNHDQIVYNIYGNGYRMLTEMEWMYAALGGNLSNGSLYSGSNDVDSVAWYSGNNTPIGNKPVGTKSANELGIYDMSGNVWEMVWDKWGEYSDTPQFNPTGAISSPYRTARGGSYGNDSSLCTVSFRNVISATDQSSGLGFRICRSLDTTNDFIFIEGGTYNNGSSNVTLSSFYCDKYEVTQQDYLSGIGSNPSVFVGDLSHPVDSISWYEAIVYCNKRSVLDGLTPCYSYSNCGTNPDNWTYGWNTDNANNINVSCNWAANGYRLPTEMEWMYAARGGNKSFNYIYSGSDIIDDVAWYVNNSNGTTHPVGTRNMNELGLFDMSGNVYEWVWDIYGDYPTEPQTNPTGPEVSTLTRIMRGCSWGGNPSGCTVAYRATGGVTLHSPHLGFRVCRTVE